MAPEAPEHLPDNARSAHTSWWDALLASDVVTLDGLLADDWTFHSPYGTTSTKEAFVENLVSGRLSHDSVDGDTVLVRAQGHTAIGTGQVGLRFQWEGQAGLEKL